MSTAATFDRLIAEVVSRHVDGVIAPLTIELEELRRKVAEIDPQRWPAMMPPWQAAEYLGISKTTLNSLVARGLIAPTIPYGMQQRFYPREELDRYIKGEAA